MPRTWSRPSGSGWPLPFEKRTLTGTEEPSKWFALQYSAAVLVATNDPATPTPFVWIGRVPPTCSGKHGPIASSSASISVGEIAATLNGNSRTNFPLALPSPHPVHLDGGSEADVDHG